jgi:hypothetical protein
VTKRKQSVEDHYDNCGDDLGSLSDTMLAALVKRPCDSDAENELSDDDRNECLFLEFPRIVQVYPADLARVPQPAEGGVPGPGRDSRAPPSRESPRPGCKHSRARKDWERNRKNLRMRLPTSQA